MLVDLSYYACEMVCNASSAGRKYFKMEMLWLREVKGGRERF
jgi:hypothetical protein